MAGARGKGSLIISAHSHREYALMQFLKKQKPIIWLLSTKKSII
jgi:hypothetical protein